MFECGMKAHTNVRYNVAMLELLVVSKTKTNLTIIQKLCQSMRLSTLFTVLYCIKNAFVFGDDSERKQKIKGNDPGHRNLALPIRKTPPAGSKNLLKLPRATRTRPPTTTEKATQSPTCSPIDFSGYFEKGEFVSRSGGQDATYTVECNEQLDIIVLKSNPLSCQVECFGSLSSSLHMAVCKEEKEVTFTLEGDYRLENILIGSLAKDIQLSCNTMVLITEAPTKNPTVAPSPNPTKRPTLPPMAPTTTNFQERVVLESSSRLERGQFVSSPSGEYEVGLSLSGDLVLRDSESYTIWNAGVSDGYRVYMQGDGNLIVRKENGSGLWKSETHKNYGARFVIDDGGQISVKYGDTAIWIAGVPRGEYTGPSSEDLKFPIRGMFYYAWFPETWTSSGVYARYKPDLGWYRTDDPLVVESHIDAFEYANIELGIISWWGVATKNERARIHHLMGETLRLKSQVKWTVYYEDEMDEDPTVEMIKSDLDYLKKWFAWHRAFAHIDGKPVIFVYNNGDCEVAERFMKAANGEWHVVLRLFGGYKDCPIQPSSWHQYGPGSAVLQYEDVSFSISAGFWHARSSTPKLPRLNKKEYCGNVQSMVDSGYPWQLITTFNEAVEGTAIEQSAANWPSDSGYGIYLDCLHEIV